MRWVLTNIEAVVAVSTIIARLRDKLELDLKKIVSWICLVTGLINQTSESSICMTM